MQIQKLITVDKGMCERFTHIWRISRLPRAAFARQCGLRHGISCINEIANHVTEPSKKMIVALYHNLGVNPNYILIGVGEIFLDKNQRNGFR